MTEVNKYIQSAKRGGGFGFPLVSFPRQKLSIKEKGEDWGKDCVDGIIAKSFGNTNSSFNGRNTQYRKKINYDLMNSIFREEDFEYVLDPYNLGWDYNMPSRMQDFNIIRPKIELLKGEEIKRPFSFMAVGVVGEVINVRNQEKEKLLKQSFEQYLNIELQKYGLAEPEVDQEGNPVQPKTPKQLEDIMNMSYQDIREKYANDIIQFLVPYLKLEAKFNKGWEHGLVSTEEIYYTGIHNNEPACRVVNPLNFDYDKTQDLEDIEDAQWCYEERFMAVGEIIDEFGDFLTEDEIDMLDTNQVGIPMSTNSPLPGFAYDRSSLDNSSNSYSRSDVVHIKVVTVCWKSLRKIAFVSYIDENGDPQETVSDESFKLTPEMKNMGVSVDYKWINEVWKGTKIGSEIYIDIEPLPNQIRNLDNIGECKLPYVGKIYNSLNTKATSVVDLLKPHQYTYTIVWYRLLNELAKAKGKKMVFDIAQLPKSHGIDFEKWMYYFDSMGIAVINSVEEGREGDPNTISKFNQYTAIDMSLSQVVAQYMMILDKLEDMAGEICGVSRQRQGQIFASETVGNVEKSQVQSSMITESLFSKHNEVKQKVLTRLVELSKLAYKNGKKLQYLLDDGYKVFLNLDKEAMGLMQDSEFGVFVSNSSRDFRIKEQLQALAQSALQNDMLKFSDIITIMKSNSISEIKNKLLKGEEDKNQREQERFEQEQNTQKEIQQSQIAWEREKMDREDAQKQLDRENKLEVATLNTMRGKDGPSDLDGNGVIDALENSKLFLEESRLASDNINKDKELALKEREMNLKANIEQMKADTQLKIAKENKNKFDNKTKKK